MKNVVPQEKTRDTGAIFWFFQRTHPRNLNLHLVFSIPDWFGLAVLEYP